MTETETELRQQEFERVSLQSAVSSLQAALMFAAGDSRRVLETAFRNASSRLSTVETKVKELQGKHDDEVKEANTRVATLAAQETRLNAQEKETFAGFMKEDFFVKADFGELNKFYKKSWDRLSEHGKDEMSQRIWEGIRKGKYTFGELPASVREKEAERAYQVLRRRETGTGEGLGIPEQDRADFMKAFEAGNREETEQVLQRKSFKKSLFIAPESAAKEHNAATRGRESEIAVASVNVAETKSQVGLQMAPEAAKKGAKNLAAYALDGVKLVDTQTQGTSADIPSARTSTTAPSRSTPGS